MKNPSPSLLKAARKLALLEVNANRAERGLAPLVRIERLWWSNYGREYIARAATALSR